MSNNATIKDCRKLHHIWVGPLEPPLDWINSWKVLNWDHKIWNDEDIETFGFKNYESIKYYFDNRIYAGAADLMRYEILYRYGGFMPGSDCELISSVAEIEDLLNCELITVYENEAIRPGLVSPVLGSTKGNPFLSLLIDTLYENKPTGEPWMVTGNLFVQKMIEKHKPDIKITPSNYLIGDHFCGYPGVGDKRYAKQHWGTTKGLYKSKSTP